MCVFIDLLSCSLKSFDILLMSVSLRIVGLRCIVALDNREDSRSSLRAMMNTCISSKQTKFEFREAVMSLENQGDYIYVPMSRFARQKTSLGNISPRRL